MPATVIQKIVKIWKYDGRCIMYCNQEMQIRRQKKEKKKKKKNKNKKTNRFRNSSKLLKLSESKLQKWKLSGAWFWSRVLVVIKVVWCIILSSGTRYVSQAQGTQNGHLIVHLVHKHCCAWSLLLHERLQSLCAATSHLNLNFWIWTERQQQLH